jgi:hypothetical protein
MSLVIIILLIACLAYYICSKIKEPYGKKHNIYISDTCKNYSPNIVKYILSSDNVVEVNNKNDAEINVYHIADNNYAPNKINIVISGEVNQVENNIDMCISTISNQNAKFNIYYPFMYSSLHERRKSTNNKDYISPKTKFCCFMYKAHHEHRVKYFKLLSSYKKVDALGKSCNNVNIPDTRGINNESETYNDIAVDLYKNYKFVIAVENGDKPGYFTEKILNPIIANSIPIYWGNHDVFNFINKKRVIYIPDYTDNELLKLIERLDNNDNEYQAIISQPIYVGTDKDPSNIENKVQQEIKATMKKILKE